MHRSVESGGDELDEKVHGTLTAAHWNDTTKLCIIMCAEINV